MPPAIAVVIALLATRAASPASRAQPAKAAGQPSILVIRGIDFGIWSLCHNSHGMMGYKTPNIDRIADEGLLAKSSAPAARGRQPRRAAIPV